MAEITAGNYGLYESIDSYQKNLQAIVSSLSQLEDYRTNKHFKDLVDSGKPVTKDDALTLSEKKKQDLNASFAAYQEPLMNRWECMELLDRHKKDLQSQAKARRMELRLMGGTGAGVSASDFAAYDYKTTAAVQAPHTNGAHAIKGLDPWTGEYSHVIQYEGECHIKHFQEHIKRYAASRFVDLYATLKSFLKMGQQLGMTRHQLGKVLINLMKTKEVREANDPMYTTILSNSLDEDPVACIYKIIELVSRDNQTRQIEEKLRSFKRGSNTSVDSCINALETLVREYYQHKKPFLDKTRKDAEVEQKILLMLPDFISREAYRELQKHKIINNNNGIVNTVEDHRRFLLKVEGDKKQEGGQHMSDRTFHALINFTKKAPASPGRSRSRSPPETSRPPPKPASKTASPSPGRRPMGRKSSRAGSSTRSARTRSREASRESSRASSTHSNVSTTSRTSESSAHSPHREVKKKRDSQSHFLTTEQGPVRVSRRARDGQKSSRDRRSGRSSGDKRRPTTPGGTRMCPICYEAKCGNFGREKCELRPGLQFSNASRCNICRRGYHVPRPECFEWIRQKQDIRDQQNSPKN